MSKVAAIFAHPDDEAFGPAGTICKLASEGEVRLICVTDGGKENKQEIRRQELLNSAKTLGVKQVDFLEFADGSLCNNNYHEVAKKIKNALDEFEPDTILTYDQNGVSGHIDHIAVSMICSFLYEKLDCVKKIMYFGVDKIHKEMEKDYFVYFPEGINREEADEIIDCSEWLSQKITAIKCHISQKEDGDWILENYGEYLKEELFRIRKKIIT